VQGLNGLQTQNVEVVTRNSKWLALMRLWKHLISLQTLVFSSSWAPLVTPSPSVVQQAQVTRATIVAVYLSRPVSWLIAIMTMMAVSVMRRAGAL